MTWLMPIDATKPQPRAMKIRISDFIFMVSIPRRAIARRRKR
jgi:hypothetical protein